MLGAVRCLGCAGGGTCRMRRRDGDASRPPSAAESAAAVTGRADRRREVGCGGRESGRVGGRGGGDLRTWTRHGRCGGTGSKEGVSGDDDRAARAVQGRPSGFVAPERSPPAGRLVRRSREHRGVPGDRDPGRGAEIAPPAIRPRMDHGTTRRRPRGAQARTGQASHSGVMESRATRDGAGQAPRCCFCLIPIAKVLEPLRAGAGAYRRRAYAPDAPDPAKWRFRWSSKQQSCSAWTGCLLRLRGEERRSLRELSFSAVGGERLDASVWLRHRLCG